MTGADASMFATTITAWLVTPGPTNMLLLAAGTKSGFRRAVRLVPFEMVAYFVSISIMTTVLRQALESHQYLAACLKLLAAAYLLKSAFRFWFARGAKRSTRLVSASLVFKTTILNPKALLFTLVIFPSNNPVPAFGIFFVECLVIGCGWTLLGDRLLRLDRGGHVADSGYKFAAGVHALFAVFIIVDV